MNDPLTELMKRRVSPTIFEDGSAPMQLFKKICSSLTPDFIDKKSALLIATDRVGVIKFHRF